MTIELEASGYITEKGEFIIRNKKLFLKDAQEIFKGKEVTLILRDSFKSVSDKLRKYYFGIVLGHLKQAFKDSGDIRTKKELDEKMRRLFLTKDEIDSETGKILTLPKSLSKEAEEVSNENMRSYIDSIIRFAAEHLEYGIPYPSEL